MMVITGAVVCRDSGGRTLWCCRCLGGFSNPGGGVRKFEKGVPEYTSTFIFLLAMMLAILICDVQIVC